MSFVTFGKDLGPCPRKGTPKNADRDECWKEDGHNVT